eukprot:s354_g9.t3
MKWTTRRWGSYTSCFEVGLAPGPARRRPNPWEWLLASAGVLAAPRAACGQRCGGESGQGCQKLQSRWKPKAFPAFLKIVK